jgi:hypothetical protein
MNKDCVPSRKIAEWLEKNQRIAGPNPGPRLNLNEFFTIVRLAGLTPFLAVAIVRTVSLFRASMQGGPAAGLIQPVQAGSIPIKNASSPFIPVSLSRAHPR